jgi:hypothetical protein
MFQPLSARVYVNLPEGILYNKILKTCWNSWLWIDPQVRSSSQCLTPDAYIWSMKFNELRMWSVATDQLLLQWPMKPEGYWWVESARKWSTVSCFVHVNGKLCTAALLFGHLPTSSLVLRFFSRRKWVPKMVELTVEHVISVEIAIFKGYTIF